jgi:hypothetical protein
VRNLLHGLQLCDFNILKSTKKLEFAALLKQIFYFVPRGTIVENFF